MVVEDLDRLFAELRDDALCVFRADALDETGGEIAFDAGDGPGRGADDLLRLELPPMDLVRHPFADGVEILALPHRAAGAHHDGFRGLQAEGSIPVAARDAQHGIAGFIVPEHDGRHRAVQRILRHISHGETTPSVEDRS